MRGAFPFLPSACPFHPSPLSHRRPRHRGALGPGGRRRLQPQHDAAAGGGGVGGHGGGRWGVLLSAEECFFFFFRSRVFIKTPPLFFSRPTASHNSPLSRHTRHAAQTQSEWTGWKDPPPETPPPPAGPPILLSAPSAPLPPAPLRPRRRPAKRQTHAHDASRARRGGRDGTGLLALPHGRARSRPHPHAIPPPSAPPRSCFPVPPSSLPPPQGASWRGAAV